MASRTDPESCSCCQGPRHGVDESLEEMDFQKSLHGAAHSGDVVRIRGLLERGAEVDGPDGNAYSPLHFAARNGHVEACRVLLENKASVDRRTRAGQATSLHRAAHEGHEQVVKLLLQSGANPLCQDSDGCTPLHKAAMRGHLRTVELLTTSCPQALQIPDKHGRLANDCSIGAVARHLQRRDS